MPAKMVRCPFCGYPAERTYTSHKEERYRCTVCGKQTMVYEKPEVAQEEEVVEEPDTAG